MFLGLDCGTSGLKALLVDERGGAVASASRAYLPDRPRPGWSEQNPDVWRAAMAGAITDLRAAAPEAVGAVKAIGFSGQMHGAVLLDAADRPLRPAILHNDGRAHAEAADLAREHPRLAAVVGVKPMPGFTGPKLLWLARHEPEIRSRIGCVLAPKDYLRLALTGERGTDMSDAAGQWLLDEAQRRWSPEAFAACRADAAWAPRLHEGSDAVGSLRRAAAEDFRLPAGAIVAAGGGDAAVGAIGLGAIAAGEAFISLGTATQLVVATERYLAAPERLVHSFAHALPSRWYAMAAMLNGAGALAFAARLVGSSPEALEREAADSYLGPAELMFLPYLSGERTPLDDPDARGVLFGMTETTSRADVARAVMEGVALTLAEARDCLCAASASVGRVSLIGGGAKSALWARMIAAATGFTVVRRKGGETGPAFGAARLARLAATGEAPGEVCRPPEVADVTEPDPRLAEAFARQRERFKALYSAVKPEFQRRG
ncbi:xylulokinase [Roseiarcus fermentans]|uniref:Xylulose kinase n=1 Tax=Roseiarcus fermentans TaxID=1473586 RepID=A0A366FGG0_9HYPH|nr:xylulokinase [Roseiarcus fermentans]RBP13772.1 xylulokinase [Roseiarcus fermentans]